ncbi:hypothetical protein [Cytobacillus purgationiresistens]|uniref:Uncharacterized protein n=1 Tax=Cytobacillus purgationiresistens TaxID=863449 RepID=A0ABU0AKQ3_9BACI|nr:hypothetical protein [Cytobacillus purgationiresistens]MDQ0271620.1 hypothetical protein [Cytobacillus purgationiresistens]
MKILNPFVEPNGYKGFLKVMKAVEVNQVFYSITFIRQYENASVVQLIIDWEGDDSNYHEELSNHSSVALDLGVKYDCRNEKGSGASGQYTHQFVVSPALPDEITGMAFLFKKYDTYFKDVPASQEIIIEA